MSRIHRTRLCLVALLTGCICVLPPARPAAAAAGAGASPATNARFDITEFRVLGNHLLPPVTVERAVYPFLGPARDINTVKKAAGALEKAYRDAGYGTVFVDVPEQEVTDGIVRLQVTEGKLDQVHVHGERYFSGRQIRAALPALAPGATPNLLNLQQQLTQLNSRTPDRVVTPVLKAGPGPGTMDVDLAVKDALPLHGSIEVDNRHTADTTPDRVQGALSYDDLWGRQDSIGLQYQIAPARPGDAEVLIANYLAHVGVTSGELALSYIRTRSNVLALGTLGVLGQGSIYGAHWLQPLLSTAQSSASLNAGVDYKDVLTQVLPQSSGAGSSSVTALVKYLNWSAVYSAAWRRPTHDLALTAGVNFGIRSLVNSTDQFENTRYNGAPGYMYLRVSSGADQALPLHLSLAERMSGQWSAYPLVNNEQFALGGVDTVRGYLEAESLGDSGVAGSLELHSPAAGTLFGSPFRSLYALIFLDGGSATIVDALPGQTSQISLWSYGAGLRLENARGLSASFDWADPRANASRTREGAAQIDFSARYAF